MASEQSATADKMEVRILGAADVEAVRKLFCEVFKHEMSEELWHWKYRAGNSCAIGVFKNGELVCHYGGAGATILYKGKLSKALQSVDVMVKPSVRHMARKQSPYFLASAMFLEQFIGYGKPYLLGYGFPSERAMGLAQRMGLFAPVGQMAEVSWQIDAPPGRASFFNKAIRITAANFPRYQAALDQLWQQFSEEMQEYVVVQKTAAYFEQRYLRHPGIEYCLLLIKRKFTGKALGVIVLKQEAERVLLMDVIGPAKNMFLMVQTAMGQSLQLDRKVLATWCSRKFVERFALNGAASKLLPFITPANNWTAAPTPAELQDRWWLMPGDTDYL